MHTHARNSPSSSSSAVVHTVLIRISMSSTQGDISDASAPSSSRSMTKSLFSWRWSIPLLRRRSKSHSNIDHSNPDAGSSPPVLSSPDAGPSLPVLSTSEPTSSHLATKRPEPESNSNIPTETPPTLSPEILTSNSDRIAHSMTARPESQTLVTGVSISNRFLRCPSILILGRYPRWTIYYNYRTSRGQSPKLDSFYPLLGQLETNGQPARLLRTTPSGKLPFSFQFIRVSWRPLIVTFWRLSEALALSVD